MTTPSPLLLVGAGAMAREYSKVLTTLDRPHRVLGRGAENARRFEDATGIHVGTGELDAQLAAFGELPGDAIVAANAMHLTEVTSQLALAGVGRILVEKPAALDGDELADLLDIVERTGVEIRIGYNRRYLPSVIRAREMVSEDGGVLSVTFDFSEPSRRIAALDKPQRELDTWFYGNSTHVVDLALHFAGDCESFAGEVAGGVSWHPGAGVFVGHARAQSGALVSWHADWMGPGRWGMQVVTPQRRLILQPLERLRVQDHDSFAEHEIELDYELDMGCKPGLVGQVRAFLFGYGQEHLPELSEHSARWPVYETIRTGAMPDDQTGQE